MQPTKNRLIRLAGPQIRTPFLILSVMFASGFQRDGFGAGLTAERSEHGVLVRIDGELFAEYRTCSGHQPAVWPIIGPTGRPVTRSYPIGPLLKTEESDHPHHHSLWFTHEDVNGHDFWHEPNPLQPEETRTFIHHLEFSKIESRGSEAVVVARNLWRVGKDNPICEDQRTLIFGANDECRWIDYTTKIIASHGDVTFGDRKDGTFSIRVAGTMKVNANRGGRIVNSEGLTDHAAWGLPADWVDYYGPVEGETTGIALFSHPDNFRHPCRWHVRSYGLFTANPFGDAQFPPIENKQHAKTIPAGESLTLRYRALFHRGDTEQGRVAEAYQKFVVDKSATERR
ncbi:MAG: PmoA family protein [Pirellulales bacterium]|nr:PmoA family protein [Pirellulales bacterium]